MGGDALAETITEPSRLYVDGREIASRDAELWQAAEAVAAERGEAISVFVRHALHQYIAQTGQTQKTEPASGAEQSSQTDSRGRRFAVPPGRVGSSAISSPDKLVSVLPSHHNERTGARHVSKARPTASWATS